MEEIKFVILHPEVVVLDILDVGVFHQGHLVEFLNMSSSSLKAIPCSLVKSFPNLKWWDLRSRDLLIPIANTNCALVHRSGRAQI